MPTNAMTKNAKAKKVKMPKKKPKPKNTPAPAAVDSPEAENLERSSEKQLQRAVIQITPITKKSAFFAESTKPSDSILVVRNEESDIADRRRREERLVTVQFSEKNLSEVAAEVEDIDAEAKLRSRKPTAYIPSTHPGFGGIDDALSDTSIAASSLLKFQSEHAEELGREQQRSITSMERRGRQVTVISQPNIPSPTEPRSRQESERIRSRKPTTFIPSSHVSEDDLLDQDEDEAAAAGPGEPAAVPMGFYLPMRPQFQPTSADADIEDFEDQGEDQEPMMHTKRGSAAKATSSTENIGEDQEECRDEEERERDSSGEPIVHHNKFKHRDAMEKAILKTREDYHQFHLDNPGFFTAVYERTDAADCEQEIEALVADMFEEWRKERETQMKSGATSSDTVGDSKDQEEFLQHRMEHLNWATHEWILGYQHPLQHMKNQFNVAAENDNDAHGCLPQGSGPGLDSSSGNTGSSTSCPKNLSTPKLVRHFNHAQLQQLEYARALREQKRMKAALRRKMKELEHAAGVGPTDDECEGEHEYGCRPEDGYYHGEEEGEFHLQQQKLRMDGVGVDDDNPSTTDLDE